MRHVSLVCVVLAVVLGHSVAARSGGRADFGERPPEPVRFDRCEHVFLGDLALRVALEYGEFVHHPGFLGDQRAAVESLLAREALATYGELVALMDHVLRPEELLARRGQVTGYPTRHTELSPKFIGERDGKRTIDQHFGRPEIDRYFRASSANDAHFQGDLLASFWHWHRQARYVAREDRNLFGALVMSAIADHYLQDSFAPGHILVSRDNAHDTFALTLHDNANRHGAPFAIAEDAWEDLEAIRCFVADRCASYGFSRETVEGLRGVRWITMYGDGRLKRDSPQALFMLLVEVRAILDVLEAFALPEADTHDHFATYSWKPARGYRSGPMPVPVTAPEAGTPYGRFSLSFVPYDLSTILGFSVSDEISLSSRENSRVAFALETPYPTWLSSSGSPDYVVGEDGRSLSTLNWATLVGLTYVKDADYGAIGPSARLAWGFPRVNLQLSLGTRALYYDVAGGHVRFEYGARADIGFSLVTAFFSLAEGWDLDEPRDLDRTAFFSAGFTISGPIQRLF